jgi:cytochrome c oxidase subunit 2
MKRNVLHVLVIWLVLSAAGIVGVVNADLLPATAALQGEIVDQAFRLLLVLAVPVAAFVLTMLGYSLLRFRAGDGDEEEGPALYSNRSLALSWFAITTALAVFVVFNPGLKGLRELAAAESDDALVIQVEGEQWHWNVTYPQHNLSYERALQIAVPVDTPVRFEITSADVIHSFWVPAFRMKMDAVPGKVTTLHVTADELGSFEDDPNLRVQCAELWGTHACKWACACWSKLSLRSGCRRFRRSPATAWT